MKETGFIPLIHLSPSIAIGGIGFFEYSWSQNHSRHTPATARAQRTQTQLAPEALTGIETQADMVKMRFIMIVSSVVLLFSTA